MWTESSDVTTSAYGIYYLMRANFVQDKVNVFYWGEARVGEYMWGAGSWRTGHDNDMYGVQNSTMNDSNASTVWTKLYTAVNAANAVLKYAPTVPMTDADRQWAIGQAAFARAYLYFWAVRLWGDVPLLLNPVESVDAEECYPARSPKAYVYEQIGRDIETAVAYVTSGTDKYVATPDAVNMLKAEYALWMYATPVVYPLSMLGEDWMRTLLQINPVTESVELMRYAILGQGTVNWGYYFLSWGVTLVIALLGIVVFNKVERTFMDTV